MARKVAARQNYMQEAITMRRFANAVTLDQEASEEWKRKVIDHLQKAMALFLERDSAGRKAI